MKNIVVHLVICLGMMPYVTFGQNTLIPDSAFEQALINQGYDTVIDGTILTANISSVGLLNVNDEGISDLTGIQDFSALYDLRCGNNLLTSLDLTQNTQLVGLICNDNQLTNLDVSNYNYSSISDTR